MCPVMRRKVSRGQHPHPTHSTPFTQLRIELVVPLLEMFESFVVFFFFLSHALFFKEKNN